MAPKGKRNYFPKTNSKAGKEDQQGDEKASKANEVAHVEAIPTLCYREGKPNNLNEFKEKLSTYFISKCSDCGTFIETGVRWFVPEVVPPDPLYDEYKTVNKCHKRGDPGHRSQDCPYGDKIKELIALGENAGDRSRSCQLLIYFLLNTEANVHVFCNKELLTNLRPIDEDGESSLYVEGIVRKEEICVTHVGDWGPFKNVLYCSTAVPNVLSWFKVAKTFRIDWDQKRNGVTVITTEGHEFVFTPRNDLYCYFGGE